MPLEELKIGQKVIICIGDISRDSLGMIAEITSLSIAIKFDGWKVPFWFSHNEVQIAP